MYPASLYSNILENLFMGGTADDDVIHYGQHNFGPRKDLPFDAIVTMYAWARPADWQVQEFRYGVPDAKIEDIDLHRLREAVEFASTRLDKGDRVLVRCQAGLNRSGLVTALVLIKKGMSPELAIETIRKQRGADALFNQNFVNWLLTAGANFINPTDLPMSA